MAERILTLLLITSIVVCPLRCAEGHCGDPHRCGAGAAVATDGGGEHGEACDGTCATEHGHASQPLAGGEARHHQEQPSCPCGGDSACQCVCAGALFERDVLPAGSSCPQLSVEPATVADDGRLPQIARRVHARDPASGQNYGRFLRTLHASFLC